MDNRKVFSIPCTLMRCGTSKAVFLMEEELPKDVRQRDRLILSLFGSPDLRQVDGLGGADSAYSKVAIIKRSSRADADVDYTYGQVSLDRAFIDYNGNCGNVSTGVGVYAIHKGLVKPEEPETIVRIHVTNSGRILQAKVKVSDGTPEVDGEFKDSSVPGTGAAVEMNWAGITGSMTGQLLPTGNTKDEYVIDNVHYRVSIVDAGNIAIYLNAKELGLKGTESPAELNKCRGLCERLEKLRGTICVQLNLVERWEEAKEKTPLQPFIVIVSKPKNREANIISCLSLLQKFIPLYPGTALVNIGAAQKVDGSIVRELATEPDSGENFKISCASGILSVEVKASIEGKALAFSDITIRRTARVLMDGIAYVRKSTLYGQ